MNITPQDQQDLLDIASEMATEIRCFLLDTVGDGSEPQTRQSTALLYRYMALRARIDKTQESNS